MNTNVDDILHCEEQLKNALHCDDKEKLRRKLAQLKREYLKTAQRLERAERLEAVQRHVRSRITQQNQQDERAPGVTSNPCLNSSVQNTSNATNTDMAPCQEHTEGAALSDTSRRSQMIRFMLPSDAACPQTPDPSHDRGHKSSTALRLRSRRSRQRWERRSTEADRNTGNSEQSESLESATILNQEGLDKSKETDAVDESEELFSSTGSESPSLLLTHWNTQGNTEAGGVMEKELQIQQKQREPETDLEVEGKCCNPALSTEEKGLNVTENGKKDMVRRKVGARCRIQREMGECKENNNENTEQNAAETIESKKCHDDLVEMNKGKKGNTEDGKAVGLLDSCTLVDGLLFPVEYYIRTTRRMTFSQSQPDMQAVILSQLSMGRQRRGRGRGRGLNREMHTRTDLSSPTAAFTSPPLNVCVPANNASAECSQSSSEISNPITASHPPRGRRKRRGRGRPRTSQTPLNQSNHQLHYKQSLGNPIPTSTSVSSSQSPHKAEGTNFSPQDTVPEPDGTQSSSIHIPATSQTSSGVDKTLCSPVSENPKKIYPIFLKSSIKTINPPQMNRGTSSWPSLLLPSSSSPPQTSLLPLPSLSPGWLVSNLTKLDIHQDFHLPDDQFACLKLHKLRQVAVESGLEHFSTPSHNTRSSIRRINLGYTSSDQLTPLHLPFSSNKGNETVTSPSHNQSWTSMNYSDKPQPHPNFTDKPQCEVNDCIIGHSDDFPASENQTACGVVVHSLQDQSPEVENRAITGTLSFDNSQKETQKKASNNCTALQAHSDPKAPGESPVNGTKKRYSSEDADEHSVSSAQLSPNELFENKTTCIFTTPHLPSSTLTSSPVLPSIGLTPYPVAVVPQLNSSLSAPSLTLPPPHSLSTQALSPPALSPCSTITHLPSSLPPLLLSTQIQVSCEPPDTSNQCQEVERAACATQSNMQLQSPAKLMGVTREQTTEKQMMRCTHILKAAAGGSLVDVCCFSRSSGDLCVAAAGKWAVCLWSQTLASDWSLIHTWTFSEPVVNVFPVPDAAGLMCVTLGQLEIREVRMLSCSSLMQMLVCEGVIQAVVGMSESRVGTSSHSASGSTLQVFTLSDSSTSPISQPLVSPGVCVGALAPVDGVSDALIGTDECGRLFIWNVKTGQLLCRVLLGHGLSHTTCLKGYSYCGMLLVLQQHQFLSSMEEEEKEVKIKDEIVLEEETKTTLFSVVGINPLNGKSVLATRLHPPKAWSGRLCESDVTRTSIVGLSQSGCLCVWELGKQGTSQMVGAPDGEDWQLVRWGGRNRLVIGHHNGDVSLHNYSVDQT
ncbi:partner and localizer of BRCA2 isoform X2 [Melanotaenia boesemani]|uniref:partner and localizer of BRCA2 isoform X2 n=1 Tax=Melanotaenia boesemani TaxID=1250792 RepID=UPI001C044ADC|nr:partner and localizer of BRCA2 isoform X2 [Melanotaenia boesemani]